MRSHGWLDSVDAYSSKQTPKRLSPRRRSGGSAPRTWKRLQFRSSQRDPRGQEVGEGASQVDEAWRPGAMKHEMGCVRPGVGHPGLNGSVARHVYCRKKHAASEEGGQYRKGNDLHGPRRRAIRYRHCCLPRDGVGLAQRRAISSQRAGEVKMPSHITGSTSRSTVPCTVRSPSRRQHRLLCQSRALPDIRVAFRACRVASSSSGPVSGRGP
jgi:hypothetical protein